MYPYGRKKAWYNCFAYVRDLVPLNVSRILTIPYDSSATYRVSRDSKMIRDSERTTDALFGDNIL